MPTLTPNGVIGVRRGQSHTDRLGAAQGRHHLLAQQYQQFFFCDHSYAPFLKTVCLYLWFYIEAIFVPIVFTLIFPKSLAGTGFV